MLAGKKTYITVAVAILSAGAAFVGGQIDLAELMQTITTALIGAFVRAGITMEVKK